MMNLKKLGVLGIASCALFATGCQREPATTILSHDEAKEWVKNNYGAAAIDFVAPKSVTSEWGIDAYVADGAGAHTAAYKYLVEHTENFLANYAYVNRASVTATAVATTELNFDELGYKTKSPIKNEIQLDASNFTRPMRSNIFDEVLNSTAYYGIAKYNCDYIVDDFNKTLTINGTCDVYKKVNVQVGGTTYEGYHIFHLADCSVKFNNKGYLESIKFDITQNTEARYNWYNATEESWSSTVSGIVLKGSYIHFNYNY